MIHWGVLIRAKNNFAWNKIWFLGQYNSEICVYRSREMKIGNFKQAVNSFSEATRHTIKFVLLDSNCGGERENLVSTAESKKRCFTCWKLPSQVIELLSLAQHGNILWFWARENRAARERVAQHHSSGLDSLSIFSLPTFSLALFFVSVVSSWGSSGRVHTDVLLLLCCTEPFFALMFIAPCVTSEYFTTCRLWNIFILLLFCCFEEWNIISFLFLLNLMDYNC